MSTGRNVTAPPQRAPFQLPGEQIPPTVRYAATALRAGEPLTTNQAEALALLVLSCDRLFGRHQLQADLLPGLRMTVESYGL